MTSIRYEINVTSQHVVINFAEKESGRNVSAAFYHGQAIEFSRLIRAAATHMKWREAVEAVEAVKNP